MSTPLICYKGAGDQCENDDQHDALFAFGKIENPSFQFFAYWMGSSIPASRKPLSRKRQESHSPQARPSGDGS
jgi:hypothetical protein